MRPSISIASIVALCVVAGSALMSRAVADDRDTCANRTGDESIAACTRAIMSGRWLGAELAWAYANRGAEYRSKGDYERAIADANEALRLDPTHANAYVIRGNVYTEKGDYDRAIANQNEAIRLDPQLVAAYYNRGMAYRAKGDYARAIADYSEAIRLAPAFAGAYSNRCFARVIIGQLESALGDCDESLRLQPGHANTLDTRGMAYLKLGELDDAIIDYDAALRLSPNKASSLYGRGLALLRNGETLRGNGDVSAARAIEADIVDRFARYGIGLGVEGADPARRFRSPAPTPECARAETHWLSVEEIRTVAAYRDHLARFPTCDFAALAAARIQALTR